MGSLNNSTTRLATRPKGTMTQQVHDAAESSGETSTRLAESSISTDIGFLLAKLHAAGSVLNNAALAEFGLKERSYSVLALACGNLGPTQRELAEFLSLDPSQIVALIDELEQRGLVERKPGPSTGGRNWCPPQRPAAPSILPPRRQRRQPSRDSWPCLPARRWGPFAPFSARPSGPGIPWNASSNIAVSAACAAGAKAGEQGFDGVGPNGKTDPIHRGL